MHENQSSKRACRAILERIRSAMDPAHWIPRTEAEGKRFLVRNLILHFRPATVPRSTLRFTLTWGLGGAAATLVLMQLTTGILLTFAYEPTPVAAYPSILRLTQSVMFGRLIRNAHHWCANLLMVAAFLHMLRVFFTGGLYAPRRLNWLIGLGLIGLLMAANFTGYLLPWDQLAYWAVTVSMGMLDYMPWIGPVLKNTLTNGGDLGAGTLRLFYAAHTSLLPLLLVILMGFHFWRIRKAGGLVVPKPVDDQTAVRPERLATLPHLIVREAAVALVWIAMVLWLASWFDASLAGPANPGLSPNPTKAPWYFAGFQEMLLHLHPIFAVFVLPLVLVTGLAVTPFLSDGADARGIWFISRKGKRTALAAVVAGAVLTIAAVLLNEWVWPLPQGILGGGLAPFSVLAALFVGYGLWMRKTATASASETIQALYTLMITILVVLMVINVWFRGQGMKITMP